MSTQTRIAFLGIGLMGRHQATHLLRAGHPLAAWNRTRAKAESLPGAEVFDAPAAAAATADIVVLMLENGPVVSDILFTQGVAKALRPGAIVIDMSSIKPAEAQDHASRLAALGIHHIDAPVSGGTVGAENASLAIMAGGDQAIFDRIEPILRLMGRPTHVGPAGAGQLAKLANQIIVGVTIGAVAEALMLAQRGGADPAKVREALRGGFAESRVLDLHGGRMVARDFETRGRSVTHLKDIDNALDAAARLAVLDTPFTQATAEVFRRVVGACGGFGPLGAAVELERRNPLVGETT